MQHDPDSNTLTWLLSRLNVIQLGSSVHDATTVDLLRKLLSKEDYVSIAGQLKHASDAKNLLDFMLHSLHERCLSSPDTAIHLNRRARRLMIKIVSKMPVIPSSLFVTGVNVPANREYIGGGGFGHILKGELRGEAVALKVLYKTDSDVAFCREALMWRSLDHNLVLPFLGIHEDESASQFFLVSPYMKNGTLAQWRKKENPSVVHIEERMLELAHGIEYIHSEGIAHGDLRGANILLDDELHVKIADFGLTRLSEATNTRSGALHLNFAAPELFGCSENDDSDSSNDISTRTQMSDVYAFGCVYYEIHFDSIPFAGKPDIQILTLISRGTLPSRLNEPPLRDEAWDMIQRCWLRKPSERPTIKDVAQRMMALYQSAFAPTNARNPFYYEMLRKLSLLPLTSSTTLTNNAIGPPGLITSTSPKSAVSPRIGPNQFQEARNNDGNWSVVHNPKVPKVLDVSLLHTFKHGSVVCCVQFSPDGNYVATGCNRSAHVYDAKTGISKCYLIDNSVAGMPGDHYIRSVRFSPDGRYLVTGAEDGKISIWDIAEKRVWRTLEGHKEEIYCLDFSRDGRLIVSGSGDRTARIWELESRHCKVFAIPRMDEGVNTPDGGVTSLALSQDSRLLAVGSLDSVTRIWDVATDHLLARLKGHANSVYSVTFSADGRGLVSGSLDKTLKYWDITPVIQKLQQGPSPKIGSTTAPLVSSEKPLTLQSSANLVGHKDFVLTVAVSQDGNWVVSGSKDRCVYFWDARTGDMQLSLQGHKNSVMSLDLNPLGGLLVTGGGDHFARIWSYTYKPQTI